MTLFSIQFLLLMSAAFILFYCLPKRFQWCVLLATSIIFYYAMGGLEAGAFLLVTIVVSFLAARRMDDLAEEQKRELKSGTEPLTREQKKEIKERYGRRRKKIFVLAMIFCLGILIVLKFSDFTVQNINGLLRIAHSSRQLPIPDLLLPLGISFYTFQLTGYLIDVYKGKCRADRNILQYALFACYFPQIIQGPINRHAQLAEQLYGEHHFDEMRFRKGLLRMLWGYFKKMVISANVVILSDHIINNFETEGYRGLTVFIGVLFYGIQMYADFSGGIDIVIGISELFGISLSENFHNPYMAETVSDFWQRWHISLGHWMRDYLFYPIALSKRFSRLAKFMKKKIDPYYGKVVPSALASFIVFVTVGLWHGAAWRYVAFGFYQATLTSADTLLERPSEKLRNACRIDGDSFAWHLFRMLRTVFLINIGRYFDCTNGLKISLKMLKATFTSWNPGVLFDGSFLQMGLEPGVFRLSMYLLVLLVGVDILNEKGIIIRDVVAKQGLVFRWLFYLIAIFAILLWGSYGPGYNAAAFIYQKF
ncbi:MAG: MBOAT family O-acyltransferase [Lachnospiraceae bacterium]|nr:MBOAT family O-acyltransferase [Lachnospiraceae bacterium]